MAQEIELGHRPFRSNAGQAMVEYILILIISVTILLMLIAQIFTPMQAFIKAYMGDYVECLLETGELPTLGGETRVRDPEGCEAQFEKASFARGRPRNQAEEEAAAREQKRQRDAAARERSGGGGGRYAGSAGRTPGDFSSRSSRGSAEASAPNPKIVEISIGSTEEAGFRRPSSSSSSREYGRRSYDNVITYGLTREEQEKIEKETKGPSRVIASNVSDQASKKMIIKPPAAPKIRNDEDISWGIGDYLRYILIAAIIIILILLIGGQAARLAKGWEK